MSNASETVVATATARERAAARSKRERSRSLKRWAKRIALAAMALALALAVVMALIPDPIAVDVASAVRGPMEIAVTEDGKTRVKHRYIISAPLAGEMPRLTLFEGDPVGAGEVLARIVPPASPLLDARTRAQSEARLTAALAAERQARAHVSRAGVASDEAEHHLERQRKLVASAVSPAANLETAEFTARVRAEELAAARFGARVATEEVASARAALGLITKRRRGGAEELEIRTPVAARVLRVIRRDAGLIAAGTPIVEVGDPGSLEVVVDVLTRDAVAIREGAPVRIVRWGGDHTIIGHVERIEPSAFTRISALGVEEQRVNVIVVLDDPAETWSVLGDGYRVEAQIEIFRGNDLVTVPASSVFRHEEGWAVFAIDDGAAKLVAVDAGNRNDTQVEIRSGLAEGARVIRHPSERVADGTKVDVR